MTATCISSTVKNDEPEMAPYTVLDFDDLDAIYAGRTAPAFVAAIYTDFGYAELTPADARTLITDARAAGLDEIGDDLETVFFD